VRKTAALCIPKLYEVSPELIVEHGVIETMQELLQNEGNALVLANLIVALQEIGRLKYNYDS
jgi:AP-1 complex subunit beta-1